MFEAQPVEQMLDAFVERRAGEAVQLAEVANVLSRRQARIEPSRVGQQAHGALRAERIGDHVRAVDVDGAGVGPHQAREHAQRGRLAGAVRAEQARDGAVRGLKADTADRFDVAEALAQALDADHGRPGPV